MGLLYTIRKELSFKVMNYLLMIFLRICFADKFPQVSQSE